MIDSLKQIMEPAAVNLTGLSVIGLSLSETLIIVQILVGISLVVYNSIKIYEFFKKKL
tara:strand:- start:212 stop:385 length:174 start_codon:yes stop_codon:yes gene_type:complete